MSYMRFPDANDREHYGKEFVKNFLDSLGQGKYILTNQFANSIIINGIGSLRKMFEEHECFGEFETIVVEPFLKRYPSLISASSKDDMYVLF